MRLIDADLLDAEITNFSVRITGTPKQQTVVNECKSSFKKMIEEQPTVKSIHGKWKNMDWYDEWECSECGHQEYGYDEYPTDGKNGLNFCPNCGADMRKKVKECKTAINADHIRNMTYEGDLADAWKLAKNINNLNWNGIKHIFGDGARSARDVMDMYTPQEAAQKLQEWKDKQCESEV